jgi:oligosaccharide repeat unit polymerase
MVLFILTFIAFLSESSTLNILLASIISLIAIAFYRLNYIHPLVAYLVPWSFICLVSQLNISAVSRNFSIETSYLLLGALFSSIITYVLVIKRNNSKNILTLQTLSENIYNLRYYFAIGLYLLLLVVNIIYSKYIPVINLILYGQGTSGYIGFGIPSLYGLFNAYANALAILSLFFFLTTKRSLYIIVYLLILIIFAALISRQNITSVLVESLVVITVIKGRIPLFKLIIYILLFSALFTIIGEFRTGDITGLVMLNENFNWLPKGFVWFYSYSYFNLLNFDNLVNILGGGQYDGSSLDKLIPSFMRSPQSFNMGDFLEIPAFAVSSYMFEIYRDIGFIGVILFTILMQIIGGLSYNSVLSNANYRTVATYSVIFFCLIFSFFVNFLFYLPVIFQVVFIYIFSHTLIRKNYLLSGRKPK